MGRNLNQLQFLKRSIGMFCKNCGTQNPENATFCQNCGQPLNNDSIAKMKIVNNEVICPHCGQINPDNAAFCKNCGLALQNKPLAADNKKSRSQIITKPVQGHHRGIYVSLIILIILLIGGGSFAYYEHMQTSKQFITTRNKKVISQSKQSTNKTQQSVQKTNTDIFPTDQVKKIVTNDLSNLSGQNSAYVAPMNGDAVVIQDNRKQRAASLIKLFIMITAYQKVNDDQLNLNDRHTLIDDEKVAGTGDLQNMPDGSSLTYQDIMQRMIDDSDNTAANIMIDKLGGLTTVNDEIDSLGLSDTRLERKMLDSDALDAGKDNYTSVKDVGTILKKIYQKKLISAKYDQDMLDILSQNTNHTKLPHLLPNSVTVYNKTGEYSDYGVQNDAAIIKNTKGAFVVIVLSQNGFEQEQITTMNKLGLSLYQTILGG